MDFPEKVTINEMVLRDGLQLEKKDCECRRETDFILILNKTQE